MNKKTVTVIQKTYLGLEVETSIRLIELGLSELQKIDEKNDFYFLPFLLLSSGFERLMKCMICFKSYKDYEIFPQKKDIKTHDLIKLKEIVVGFSKPQDTSGKALWNDYNFLKSNGELSQLLYILSEFGKNARYYNLDIVTAAAKSSKDTRQMWENYETEQMNKDSELKSYFEKNKLNYFYKRLNQIIIIKLEYFSRALVRQFTLGDLGTEAKRYTGVISKFLFLMDKDLGNTDY